MRVVAPLLLAACSQTGDSAGKLRFDTSTSWTGDSGDADSGDEDSASGDTATDSSADSACTPTLWYPDADGDGYGDGSAAVSACVAPPGDTADSTDCNDASAAVYPGAPETCGDGIDSNCDGVDKACPVNVDVSTADATIWSTTYGDSLGYVIAGVGDVTGDGVDDIAIGDRTTFSEFPLRTHVVPGPITATTTLASALNVYGGGTDVVGAGDLNGDGTGDLLVGDIDDYPPCVYAVYGPITADTVLPDSAVAHTDSAETVSPFGDLFTIAGAGDVDGDGLSDALLASPGRGVTLGGTSYLLRGPLAADTVQAEAWATWTGTGNWTESQASIRGDLDGDGVDDVAFGVAGVDRDAVNAVDVWTDVSAGDHAASDAPVVLTGEAGGEPCSALESGGDVDGDGYADLLVAGSWDGELAAFLVAGPVESGALADAHAILEGYAFSVSNNGDDMNGDGRADIVVSSNSDTAYLLYGPVSGVVDIANADVTYTGDAQFVWASTAGDLNGDGYDDVLLGDEFASDPADDGDTGVVYVLFGS